MCTTQKINRKGGFVVLSITISILFAGCVSSKMQLVTQEQRQLFEKRKRNI